MSYPLIICDAGRSNSKRSKQKNDCTIRAASKVLELDYDIIYDSFTLNGRKCSKGFNLAYWICSSSIGRDRFSKISFPAIKGKSRMTIIEFCKQYPEGKYICKVSKHVFAVINGTVFDTFEQRGNGCVYLAWKVKESS